MDKLNLDLFARKFIKSKVISEEKKSIAEELRVKQRYSEKIEWREGGMKQIYKVFDNYIYRSVAMAELKDGHKDLIEPFLREARLTSKLEHPNIISIYDIGLHQNGEPYFTMDFLEDRTLETFLENKKKNDSRIEKNDFIRECLKIFIKVCDAISYAHSKGVVHLDIKLSNIHIGRFGEVWVCDWGIGKSLLEQDDDVEIEHEDEEGVFEIWTNHRGAKGTLGRVAPEQIESYKNANKKSDIYSLGVLLYELLYKKPAFLGPSDLILKNAQEGKVNFSEEIPRSLISVIKKSMEIDPLNRYESVDDLTKEIELFLNGFSTQAEKAGLGKEIVLFIQRYKWASLVAIVMICISIGIINVFNIYYDEVQDEVKRVYENLEKEQGRSEKISDQFEQEKSKNEQQYQEILQNRWSYLGTLLNQVLYDDPLKAMKLFDESLESFAEKDKKQKYMFYILQSLFIQQKFEDILDLYEDKKSWFKNHKDDMDFVDISKKYISQKNTSNRLHLDELKNLLEDLFESQRRDRKAMSLKISIYDMAKRNQRNLSLPIFKEVLRFWNPKWDKTGFDYVSGKEEVIVSNRDLKNFEFKVIDARRSLFDYFSGQSLVLSDSGVKDLRHFQSMGLISLDLRNSLIRSLNPISKFPELKKVFINKGQIHDSELSILDSKYRIVIY